MDWFEGYHDKNSDKPDIPKVKRVERYRFAIAGFISNRALDVHPALDIEQEISTLNEQVKILSKHVHFSEKVLSSNPLEVPISLVDIENVATLYAKRFSEYELDLIAVISEIIEEKFKDGLYERIDNYLKQEEKVLSSFEFAFNAFSAIDFKSRECIVLCSGEAVGFYWNLFGGDQIDREFTVILSAEFTVDVSDLQISDIDIQIQ